MVSRQLLRNRRRRKRRAARRKARNAELKAKLSKKVTRLRRMSRVVRSLSQRSLMAASAAAASPAAPPTPPPRGSPGSGANPPTLPGVRETGKVTESQDAGCTVVNGCVPLRLLRWAGWGTAALALPRWAWRGTHHRHAACWCCHRYKLCGELGRGAFGVVYRASCSHSGVPNSVVRPTMHVAARVAVAPTSPLPPPPHAAAAHAQAVKVLSKSKLSRKRDFKRVGRRVTVTTALDKVNTELAVMKKLSYRHVVRCFEIIDDPEEDSIYLGTPTRLACAPDCARVRLGQEADMMASCGCSARVWVQ